MAKQTLTYVPQTLDLVLYAGDGTSFSLTVTNPDETPVNLTGVIIAQIRTEREADDPPSAEFDVNLDDAVLGIAVLELTGDQTHALITPEKFVGVWDVQWTPDGGEPMTLCQGKVECFPDVSH
jgi:hypothetical protein